MLAQKRQAEKAAAEQKKKEDTIKKQSESINLAQCDLGASP